MYMYNQGHDQNRWLRYMFIWKHILTFGKEMNKYSIEMSEIVTVNLNVSLVNA